LKEIHPDPSVNDSSIAEDPIDHFPSSVAPRKPAIYLVVILPVFVVGYFCLIIYLMNIYSRITGVPPAALPFVNGMLIGLAALFLWTPISLVLSNFVMYCIPPLRRIAEGYVARTERPGYVESQKLLLKVAVGFALICLPLIVLGFIL
jgi:hypothetical protein